METSIKQLRTSNWPSKQPSTVTRTCMNQRKKNSTELSVNLTLSIKNGWLRNKRNQANKIEPRAI